MSAKPPKEPKAPKPPKEPKAPKPPKDKIVKRTRGQLAVEAVAGASLVTIETGPAHGYDPRTLGARCDLCPLRREQTRYQDDGSVGRWAPVPPEHNAGANVLIVGEAPGRDEEATGRPFVGRSGMFLERVLATGFNVARTAMSYTNVLMCRPPNNDLDGFLYRLGKENREIEEENEQRRVAGLPPRPLIPSPVACCWPRLFTELQRYTKVIALGGISARYVADARGGIMGERGAYREVTLLTERGPHKLAVVPGLHPAFVLRSPKWGAIFWWDLVRASRWFTGTIQWRPPTIIRNPSPRDLESFLWSKQRFFAWDVETDAKESLNANLRCIGVGTADTVMVVHTLGIDGRTLFYPPEVLGVLADIFRRWLTDASIAKVGHNSIGYDTIVMLMKLGIWVKNQLDCYLDAETEFLTQRGWRAYDDVRDGEPVGTITPEGRLEWQVPTLRVAKPFTGDLYCLETRHTRTVVTPTHRMWCQPVKQDGKAWRGAPQGPWGFRHVQDMPGAVGVDFAIQRACAPDAEEGTVTDPDELALLALFITDGTLAGNTDARGVWRPHTITISQEEGGKAEPRLRALHAAGLITSTHRAVRAEAHRSYPCVEISWRVNDGARAARYLSWCGRYSRDMRLPPMVWTWSPAERRYFIDMLFLGDGCPKAGATAHDVWTYRTASPALAGDVQALALSLGWTATTWRAKDGTWYVYIWRGEDWTVSVRARLRTRDRNGKLSLVPVTDARVVCFGVPNTTLITRSRGKPAFHGNTMLFHKHHSSEHPHNLEFVTTTMLDNPKWKTDREGKKKATEAETDLELGTYNAYDVAATAAVFPELHASVKARGQLEVCRKDHRLLLAGAEMHINGMYVLQDKRRAWERKLRKTFATMEATIREILGEPKLNVLSTMQLADILFKKSKIVPLTFTARGAAALDDDAIRAMIVSSTTPRSAARDAERRARVERQSPPDLIDALLALRRARRAQKYLGTYIVRLRPAIESCEDDYQWEDEDDDADTRVERRKSRDLKPGVVLADGRVHPTWNVLPTSGRYNSSGPNLQNIPSRLKDIFGANPGNVLVGVDADQLENRVASARWGEERYLQVFRRAKLPGIKPWEADPHIETMRMVFGEERVAAMDGQPNEKAPKGSKSFKRGRDLGKRVAYACLVKDTPVVVLDARGAVEIGNCKPGDETWAWSKERSRYEPATITRVWATGRRDCVKVTFRWWQGPADARTEVTDSVTLTPDHLMLLRDGTERVAGLLQPGDRLMPFHRLATSDGYRRVQARNDGGYIPEHRAALGMYGKTRPGDDHVHHQDRVRSNNQRANLARMGASEHMRLHAHEDYKARAILRFGHDLSHQEKMARGRKYSARWHAAVRRARTPEEVRKTVTTRRLRATWGNNTASKLDAYQDRFGILSDKEIAGLAGCTTANVRLYRQKRGIPCAPTMRGGAESPRQRVLALRELLGVWSDTAVARRVGCDRTTVNNIRHELGIPRAKQANPGKGRTTFDFAAHRAIIGTVPDRVVAEKLGCTGARVAQWRKEHGIPAAHTILRQKLAVLTDADVLRIVGPLPDGLLAEVRAVCGSAGGVRREVSALDAFADDIGHLPDAVIGARAQVHPVVVHAYRLARGIPADGEWTNHEVVSVEPAGEHEVWDIEVDHEDHNFALAAGVFAHNSAYGANSKTVWDVITSAEDDDDNLIYADLPLAEVVAMHTNWLKNCAAYPAGWQAEVAAWLAQGYLTEPIWGRRRDFLDSTRDQPDRNELCNFPIQGSGIAIVNDALFELLDAVPHQRFGPGTGLVQHGHDALIFEVPAAFATEMMRLQNGAMNRRYACYDVDFSGESAAGPTWKDT